MTFREALLLGLPEIIFSNDCWLKSGWDTAGSGEKCRGCLVGAALYSMGVRDQSQILKDSLTPYWPWTVKVKLEDFVCPLPNCYTHERIEKFGSFPAWVTHLATHYRTGSLTAEQIADVVGVVEDKYDPPKPEVLEVEVKEVEKEAVCD